MRGRKGNGDYLLFVSLIGQFANLSPLNSPLAGQASGSNQNQTQPPRRGDTVDTFDDETLPPPAYEEPQ